MKKRKEWTAGFKFLPEREFILMVASGLVLWCPSDYILSTIFFFFTSEAAVKNAEDNNIHCAASFDISRTCIFSSPFS